jgi:hypothetical protein
MKRNSVCISSGMYSFLKKHCVKKYFKRHIITEENNERQLVTEFEWDFEYENIGSIVNEKGKPIHILKKYKLKNEKFVKEFIQGKIENDIYFIALKYAHNGVRVKETLWNNIKIIWN